MNPDVAKYGLDPIPMIVIGSVMLVLTAIATSLRVYVRASLMRCFGWDDGMLVAAFCFFTANCIDLIVMGKNQATESIEVSLQKNEMVVLTGILFYVLTEIFVKMSAAIFFLRIVRETWQRRTIKISVSIYVSYMTTLVFITIFQCGNPRNIHAHVHCLDWHTTMGPISYLGGALTAATDWIFVITTLSLVLKSHMPARAKASVCFLISLAALGSIVSIVRIPFIRGGRISMIQAPKLSRITILSTIETGLSVISLSLATLRPLVRTWVDAMSSKLSSNSDQAAKVDQAAIEMQRFQAAHHGAQGAEPGTKRPAVYQREDSYQYPRGIITIDMPTGISGHCGILDSVDRD